MFTKILVLPFMIAMIVTSVARAEPGSERNPASLRGLRALLVETHYNAPVNQRDGLTRDALRSEVELRLSLAGLHPLTREEWIKTPGKPYLYVNVVGSSINPAQVDAGFFYTVSLQLVEQVKPERWPYARCEGVTWSRGDTMVVPRSRLRTITEVVGNLASEFTKAVQKANGKNVVG